MDHQEKHHQQHQKEREQEKKQQHAHEVQKSQNDLPFHPLWLVVIGVILVVVALLIWTLFLYMA